MPAVLGNGGGSASREKAAWLIIVGGFEAVVVVVLPHKHSCVMQGLAVHFPSLGYWVSSDIVAWRQGQGDRYRGR